MVEPGSIEESIRAGLACTHLEVRGDGAHFEAARGRPDFAGLNRARRHQLGYPPPRAPLPEEMHAVALPPRPPAATAPP